MIEPRAIEECKIQIIHRTQLKKGDYVLYANLLTIVTEIEKQGNILIRNIKLACFDDNTNIFNTYFMYYYKVDLNHVKYKIGE
jgi:hypothetical protein